MSRAPWLTTADVARIHELTAAGYTRRQIAEAINRSMQSVGEVRGRRRKGVAEYIRPLAEVPGP